MPTPPTGRPNAWPCPTIPPLCFDFNWTLATPQLCIFTVQTQFEISWVVDRPHKQAISLPSRIVYKSHFLQPKPPPRLTGGFCTKFRNTRPPRRPTEILRHSGFTTLHNSDDFRSFFPFWAEYPACKIGFPASRNWLNDKHSAGTSMSTSLQHGCFYPQFSNVGNALRYSASLTKLAHFDLSLQCSAVCTISSVPSVPWGSHAMTMSTAND